MPVVTRPLTPKERLDRLWLVVLVPIVAAVIAIIVNTLHAAEALSPVLDRVPVFGQEREYGRLTTFRAGMTISYLESKIGPPILSQRSITGDLINNTYRGDAYFVEAVEDPSTTVKLFAVTSCDPNFKPAFKSPSGRTIILQESTFASVAVPEATTPNYFLSGATAPSYFFESIYEGNPGLYKTWIVGVNTSCKWTFKPGYRGPEGPFDASSSPYRLGINFDTTSGRGEAVYDVWSSLPQVAAFRSSTFVNTYAETDVGTDLGELGAAFYGVKDADVGQFVPGPDPILVRTLPAAS
jgi:hypothetical protein